MRTALHPFSTPCLFCTFRKDAQARLQRAEAIRKYTPPEKGKGMNASIKVIAEIASATRAQ